MRINRSIKRFFSIHCFTDLKQLALTIRVIVNCRSFLWPIVFPADFLFHFQLEFFEFPLNSIRDVSTLWIDRHSPSMLNWRTTWSIYKQRVLQYQIEPLKMNSHLLARKNSKWKYIKTKWHAKELFFLPVFLPGKVDVFSWHLVNKKMWKSNWIFQEREEKTKNQWI